MTTITYRCSDPPPGLGEWLRSTYRPRCAYFVVGIKDLGPVQIDGKVGLGGRRRYKLNVERRPASAPAEDDIVHPIYWDSRGKKPRRG